MYNLSNLLRFLPKKWSRLNGACGCVNTNIYKKCLSKLFKLFFTKQCFKIFLHNTTERESAELQPSIFQKWGTGKLIEKDSGKGFLKSGIYICATPCKNLANMKKQEKYIDWALTNPNPIPLSVATGLRGSHIFSVNLVSSSSRSFCF